MTSPENSGVISLDCASAADEIERLTRERDLWKLRAEQAQAILRAHTPEQGGLGPQLRDPKDTQSAFDVLKETFFDTPEQTASDPYRAAADEILGIKRT